MRRVTIVVCAVTLFPAISFAQRPKPCFDTFAVCPAIGGCDEGSHHALLNKLKRRKPVAPATQPTRFTHTNISSSRRQASIAGAPTDIEAGEIFRDLFITVMQREPGDWQLRPATAGAPRTRYQQMVWRGGGGSSVSVRYSGYASSDEASAALEWEKGVVPVATYLVSGLADKAYLTPSRRGGVYRFRRGVFVFTLGVREPINADRTGNLRTGCLVMLGDGTAQASGNCFVARLAARFLTAVDEVLADRKPR